ncbi:hypothetical protein [Psychroserpens algicola]|uniref:Lipoprotein n=1 Tax=Psychroserpens algicola TaxID=1719034 RepID=A0ABT0HCW6_9FLAO|nr:hypothetical protein [Psychroserpens algicola]MCK8482207.1 hypothetical protein [Psychroserpens algicola]
MKKIFLLSFLMLSLFSCSVEDSAPNFYYEVLPIESVDIPDSFEFGNVHEIKLTYFRPSGCHVFNNFFYETDLNQRTVAIITTVLPDTDCNQEAVLEEVAFNFEVNSTGPYTFRFWLGVDENGNDTYYIVEVPVDDQ